MEPAQNVALAMHEANSLQAFVTTFAWKSDRPLARMLALAPGAISRPLVRQLGRRAVASVPAHLVRTYPTWEIIRSGAQAVFRSPVQADLAWDWSSRRFDKFVARRYVPKADVVTAFEYTALASFKRAKVLGAFCVLHLPSLDSREFEDIQRREKSDWPELTSPYDHYFSSKFERRYARRLAEIELADMIIANSSLTAHSHIRAGADPTKVAIVPLGAPPPIEAVRDDRDRAQRPLVVIWAGSFSVRKGAHYLLRAWRRLAAGAGARLDVYGRVIIPERLLSEAGEQVRFYGSVPQEHLFEAFENSDVLIFPTLSDGFGMVITEAFAHGVPVITTDQAGGADLVTPPDNGIIVPAGDAEALAEALRWCLDNRSRLAAMRHGALAAARRRQWSDYRRDLIVALHDRLSLVDQPSRPLSG